MINPVTKAIAGGVARWLMTIAGTYGVDLPLDYLEPMVNGALIIVPLLWSAIQKKQSHAAIQEAKAGV